MFLLFVFVLLCIPYNSKAQLRLPNAHTEQHNNLLETQKLTPQTNIQYSTLYFVDRDDHELNIIHQIVPQKETETEYKTIVLVYDRYRDEIIGGRGSYKNKRPTKAELKQIINDAIMDLYDGNPHIRCNENHPHFDGILGLHWGMEIEDAIIHLKTMSLNNVVHIGEDNSILILNEVYWNGVKFDNLHLSYFVSNEQKRYLGDIGFSRTYKSSSEAKKLRDNIYASLCYEFGKENIEESIDQNGFKSYLVFQDFGKMQSSRINLHITKSNGLYSVVLTYYGWMEVAPKLRSKL